MTRTSQKAARPCEVSVIVPVWRVPLPMLRECAESLSKQSFPNWEVLWVLDGPDEVTRTFLEVAEREDDRNHLVLLEKNVGVSAARNAGLERAIGRWFTFVDADDFVEPELLAELLDAARCGNAPLSCCRRRRDPGEASAPGWEARAVALDFAAQEDLTLALLLAHNGACWGRLFDRERFGELRFDEDLRFGEDWVFVQRALVIAGRMAWIPRPLYVHRAREGSATRGTLRVEDFRNWLEAMKRRTLLARPLVSGNPAAALLVAWDAWQSTNNPRARLRWSPTELREAWSATQHYFKALVPERALLPWSVRIAVRGEMHFLAAFGRRPKWLHSWLSAQAFSEFSRMEEVTRLAGKPLSSFQTSKLKPMKAKGTP